jgi:N-methylhydantoinase B
MKKVLWIPPLKLYNAGEPCPVLHAMIKTNVRTPDAVFGDLAAQVSSGQAASERLIAMCERYGLVDIEGLSDEIISRSEAATRAAISKLKAGTFHGESSFDVPGGQVITLKSAVTIDPGRGRISGRFHRLDAADHERHQCRAQLHPRLFDVRDPLVPQSRSPQQHRQPRAHQGPCAGGLDPQLPVSLRQSTPGTSVGMYVPMPILKALYHVIPDRVLAEGSGAVWTMQIQGKRDDGRAFTSSMFNYSGGMGARATKTGPSATCYPTGVAAVPVEIVEAVTPVLFDRKELRPGPAAKAPCAAVMDRSSSSGF